jgi:hypothetical protein
MRRPALAALLALAALAGCGDGEERTESRDVGRFTSIEVRDGVDVVVRVGGGPSVRVRGNGERLEDVRTSVQDGTLTVSQRFRLVIGFDGGGDPVVDVRVPSVRSLGAFDGSDLDVAGVDARALRVQAEDAADVRVRGRAGSLDLEVRDASDAALGGLLVRRARVVVEDASDAQVAVRDVLDVQARDASDVRYAGSPVVRADVDESSDVRASTPAS